MALPSVIWPSGLPNWQLPGYAHQPQDRYATVRWGAGASRRRRLYTTAPQDVQAGLYLSTAQAALLDSFFEDGLLAGERAFAAPFQSLDASVKWFEARFTQPLEWAPQPGLRWQVQARLRLTGAGQASAPTPSSLAVSAVARLQGRAQASVTLDLELFVSAQLEGEAG